MAKDYAPFDVDVTTEDPGDAAITRSGSGDTVFGTRALITSDAAAWSAACGQGCGGVAYVGTFDQTSNHANYQPAFVFASGVPGEKSIAEAMSALMFAAIIHPFMVGVRGHRSTTPALPRTLNILSI